MPSRVHAEPLNDLLLYFVQGIDRPVAPPVSQITQAAAYAASQQLPMPPLAPLEQQGSGFHPGQVMICPTTRPAMTVADGNVAWQRRGQDDLLPHMFAVILACGQNSAQGSHYIRLYNDYAR